MEGIGRQYEEYKQIKAMKNPIKAGAYLFVAVITVLILFGATWFGFYVARSITVPIQRLAEATDAIAQGDLSVRIDAKATDEIGTFIDSFNRMTADLQSSKSTIEAANISLRRTNLELDRRRAYIETVVDTIAAGLLSIDKNGVVTNFNPSGETDSRAVRRPRPGTAGERSIQGVRPDAVSDYLRSHASGSAR